MINRVHIIGIGGSGMSGFAVILLARGVQVSGSDRQDSPYIAALEKLGAKITIGHRGENVRGASIVLRSSAVPDDNIEVVAAQESGIRVVKRTEFLSKLTAGKRVIAVAGTHGKTTCSAMIAWVLAELGGDPTYLIGGISKDLKGNAGAGNGPFFVIEADEYDRMFLGLQPEIAVITNLEHDHPDCYPTMDEFRGAFIQFVGLIQPGGLLVAYGDDSEVLNLCTGAAEMGVTVYQYGIQGPRLDFQAQHLAPNDTGGISFDLTTGDGPGESPRPGVHVRLRIPGEHNVLNALAALAVCSHLGFSLQEAADTLARFSGTGRRFDVYDQVDDIVLIDDYAHHPTEIRVTLQAARQRYPHSRIWAVWQPHTYSRTRTLLDQFANAFEAADRVLITDIYRARENPPENGFSAMDIAVVIKKPEVTYTPGILDALHLLEAELTSNEVVLVLSAGDADQLNVRLAQSLRARTVNPSGDQEAPHQQTGNIPGGNGTGK